MTKHFVIPDCQVKPDVAIDHLTATGHYIVDKKPDVIVCLGDFFDMQSLSSYDRSTKKAEGTRYNKDIAAGHAAMEALMAPIIAYNKSLRKTKKKQYKPRMIYCLGNHEERIMRHVNANPLLAGKLSYNDLKLESFGWEVYDFREIVEVDGISYSHYFYAPMTGRAYGGTAHSKLGKVGFSFVQGHVQGLDTAIKSLANGNIIRALVAGSFYQHDEEYKGPQANEHFRGCLMLHEVKEGNYNLMELSLEYLLNRS